MELRRSLVSPLRYAAFETPGVLFELNPIPDQPWGGQELAYYHAPMLSGSVVSWQGKEFSAEVQAGEESGGRVVWRRVWNGHFVTYQQAFAALRAELDRRVGR